MITPKSSWNSDRMAAAFCNRREPKRVVPRPAAFYTQYKIGGDTVTVLTRRGRKVFSRQFGEEITSACVVDEELRVETVNGSRFQFDIWTGKLLASATKEGQQSREALPGNCSGLASLNFSPAA